MPARRTHAYGARGVALLAAACFTFGHAQSAYCDPTTPAPLVEDAQESGALDQAKKAPADGSLVSPPAYSVDRAGTVTTMPDPVGIESIPPSPASEVASQVLAAIQSTDEQPGVKEGKAQVHFTLSNFYLKRWELELAEVELEVAILYWPDLKIAHRDLCLVSLFRGNVLRSLAELMMVTGLGDPIPLNAEERSQLRDKALKLHYNRGVAWAQSRHWSDAQAEFQWALIYGPQDPVVHRSLAFVYGNMGRFALAEREYEATFALDPGDALAHADFAFLLSSTGQRDKAVSELSEAVKIAPSTAALHVDLGWMAESRGDLDTAATELRRAVELSPQHAALWAHLGRILERQGKAEDAIQAYDKALSLEPTLDEALKHLAKLKANEPS